MFDCVILAGGGSSELTVQEGVPSKALIKINGKEMIRLVLDVYMQMKEHIRRLIIVGSVEALDFLKADYPVDILPESDSLIGNLLLAHRYLKSENYLLISSADTPLLSLAAVEDFIRQCRPFDKDFYYPIIRKEDSEKTFPGEKRTYIGLADGAFTGGNLFLVNPLAVEPSAPMIGKFLDYRKNPLKMVSLLGPGFVLGLLAKRLSISRLEKRFSGLLNVKARAIVSAYPEIGFDIDKPAHLQLINNSECRMQNAKLKDNNKGN